MDSMTVVELEKRSNAQAQAQVPTPMSVHSKAADPRWRERMAVILIASLCAGLAYLYWSA